jgi:phosphoglycolate phosphatase-like HAD superfamily hydrolase
MYHAKQTDGIELKTSWVVGDDTLELAAGWRAGCLTAGILGERQGIAGSLETDTAFVAADLPTALQALVTAVRAA